MFLFFNAKTGKMTGYGNSYNDVDPTEFNDVESVVHRDSDEIVYWKSKWRPKLISLEDGRTWVENEAKFIVEEEYGWLEHVTDEEKLDNALRIKKESGRQEVKRLLDEKLYKITDGVDIGYIVEMRRLSKLVIKNKGSDPERQLFKTRAAVLNTTSDENETAHEIRSSYANKLKNINTSHVHYENVLHDIDSSDSVDHINQLIHTFRNVLTNLIPN